MLCRMPSYLASAAFALPISGMCSSHYLCNLRIVFLFRCGLGLLSVLCFSAVNASVFFRFPLPAPFFVD